MDPDWWIEPDIYEDDFGVRRTDTQPALPDERKQFLSVSYWNQQRAKAYCYECPLLWKCRAASWDEPYHIFGGLAPADRFNIRKAGVVTPTPAPKVSIRSDIRQREDDVAKLFLGGEQPGAIAKALGFSEDCARRNIRWMLARRINQREEQEPWGLATTVPALSNGSPDAYRAGRVFSYNSAGDSA